MFYAVRLCGNPEHERYQRPIEFMTEFDIPIDIPIETETEEQMEELLKDNDLYNAGLVEIIEI